MLLSSYSSHDPQQQLSGGSGGGVIDCFVEDQLQQQQQDQMLSAAGSGGPPGLANCSMQEHQHQHQHQPQHHHHHTGLKNPSSAGGTSDPQQQQQQSSPGSGARALRIKPQPNQVLKCPRCNSLNTKFCYYNNYSLTQPRHFCKNCRRYWTKGGALRNVPVGGGCRKNKRAKQKNPSEIQSVVPGAASTASGASDKSSFPVGGDPLGRGGQLLASSSGLFDIGKDPDADQGLPGLAFTRIPHPLRLGDHHHPGSSSGGGPFEIPSTRLFGALPILPAFEAPGSGGLSTGTLNFQGLMKHENGGGGGGEFTPIYDPSLNLLGGPPPPAGPAVSSSEGSLSSFNSIGLENFVGLGLNGDLKSWRQQQQQKIQATLEDQDHSSPGGSQGIHHQSLLHLGGGGDHHGKGKSLGQDQSEWQGQSPQNQNQNQVQAQQQQQEASFMEPTGDGGYWNSPGWPMDLPIYVDHHQHYCDVKPVDHHPQGVVVPDFYSSRSRCAPPSLT